MVNVEVLHLDLEVVGVGAMVLPPLVVVVLVDKSIAVAVVVVQEETMLVAFVVVVAIVVKLGPIWVILLQALDKSNEVHSVVVELLVGEVPVGNVALGSLGVFVASLVVVDCHALVVFELVMV